MGALETIKPTFARPTQKRQSCLSVFCRFAIGFVGYVASPRGSPTAQRLVVTSKALCGPEPLFKVLSLDSQSSWSPWACLDPQPITKPQDQSWGLERQAPWPEHSFYIRGN